MRSVSRSESFFLRSGRRSPSTRRVVVGQHHLHAEQPAAHVAVPQHPAATRVGGDHAAHARVGRQVDRQLQPVRRDGRGHARQQHARAGGHRPVVDVHLERRRPAARCSARPPRHRCRAPTRRPARCSPPAAPAAPGAAPPTARRPAPGPGRPAAPRTRPGRGSPRHGCSYADRSSSGPSTAPSGSSAASDRTSTVTASSRAPRAPATTTRRPGLAYSRIGSCTSRPSAPASHSTSRSTPAMVASALPSSARLEWKMPAAERGRKSS